MRSTKPAIFTYAIGVLLSIGLGIQPALARNCSDDNQCPDNGVCRQAKSGAPGTRVCTRVVESGGIGTREAPAGTAGVGETCGQATEPTSCQPGLLCRKAQAADAGTCQRPGM